MICRLCLCELHEFVSIFNEFESHAESGIAKLIAKYFHIELQLDDAVSNKICNSCLKHLNDFHDFWLLIEGKQQTLFKELSDFKCDLIVDELAVVQLFERAEEDVKNIPLYEPSIDTVFPENIVAETNQLEAVGLSGDKIAKNRPKRSVVIEAVNKNEKDSDTASDISPDEDFYLSNLSTDSSGGSDFTSQKKKLKKKKKQKLTKNSEGTIKKKTERFCTKQERKAHENSICDSCGKSFKTKSGYKRHYKQEHSGIIQPNVQCQICNIWFKNDRTLTEHMSNHRDESSGKDFVCQLCGAVKSTKKRLAKHKEYHHSNKMYTCETCNKEFKIALALKEHIAAQHTRQPLYSCCYCPNTFNSRANMYTHKRRIHPNEWVPQRQPRKRVMANKNVASEAEQVN